MAYKRYSIYAVARKNAAAALDHTNAQMLPICRRNTSTSEGHPVAIDY